MPLTSTSCCWRKLVNTKCTIATGSFRTPLSDWMVAVPSTDRRRNTRSVTSPEDSPKPSRSRGTGGVNSHCSSPNSGIRSLESIGLASRKVYARLSAVPRHSFMRLCALILCLVASLLVIQPLVAADAAKYFEAGRKAERAGRMAEAYLLYSQAAALDPLNPFYRVKSLAVQARAALESPPKPRDSAPKPETAAA